MNHDSPICLNASVIMGRGNGGLDVNLAAMQNTSRNWLRITELRVFIDPGLDAEDPALGTDVDFGTMVDVAISVGRNDLTTGFIGTSTTPTGERIAYIPAFLLGPRISRGFTSINNSNVEFAGATGRYANQSAYTWTLPKPLFVPPNTPVKFKVRRSSSVADLDIAANYPNDFTVEVTALGTKLAKAPSARTICYPHLSAWSPRNANAALVESGEAFRNLYKEPLTLTRIIGGTASHAGMVVTNTWIQTVAAGPVILDPTSLRIYDANNNDVITPVPQVPLSPTNPSPALALSALFLDRTNSVRISDRLLPNQTYRMVVSPVVATPSEEQILLLPMLALESYREVTR